MPMVQDTKSALATQTIPDLFVATVRRRRHQPALGVIADGKLRWHTWEDLCAAVEARALALSLDGIGPGDRVAQVGPNSLQWIVNDLALQYLGAVHVPLHATMADQQRRRLIEHCGARHVIELDASANELRIGKRSNERVGKFVPPPEAVHGDTLATILYTSGTTGEPLGVMLTQHNLVANTMALSEAVGSSNELRLVILPFSHIYARTCDLYSWIERGSRLVLAERRETFIRDCQLVKPLVINAVPYLYQKLVDLVDSERDVEADAAVAVASATPGAIRDLLGGRIARCYCGGAALAPTIVERFALENIPLLPGYGLTEASPVVTVSSHREHAADTVGRPLANLEVEFAPDGEILVRGPSVMQGYWQNEDATREVLRDGWLHTGDLGEWDAAGRLKIIGRKKELLALSTGKKVVPTAIESRLCSSPWIEQAAVIGEGRTHLAAIIVPNPQRIKGEIRKQRLLVWSKKRGVSHPKIRKIIEREIRRTLADLPPQQQVAKFVVIDRGFSIERGELTPKLSLRRSVIARNFAREIEAMYGGKG